MPHKPGLWESGCKKLPKRSSHSSQSCLRASSRSSIRHKLGCYILGGNHCQEEPGTKLWLGPQAYNSEPHAARCELLNLFTMFIGGRSIDGTHESITPYITVPPEHAAAPALLVFILIKNIHVAQVLQGPRPPWRCVVHKWCSMLFSSCMYCTDCRKFLLAALRRNKAATRLSLATSKLQHVSAIDWACVCKYFACRTRCPCPKT